MLKVERIGLSPGRPGEAPAIEDVIDDGPKTMEDALKAIVARTGARRGDRAKLGPPDAESDIVGRRGPDTAWIPATSQGNRDDGERGCLEATVSALTSAISRTAAGSADKSEKPTKEMPRPPLQTIKGSATTESRESARSLLRFLGHSPLLHSEGVVWIKPAGERGTRTTHMYEHLEPFPVEDTLPLRYVVLAQKRAQFSRERRHLLKHFKEVARARPFSDAAS